MNGMNYWDRKRGVQVELAIIENNRVNAINRR